MLSRIIDKVNYRIRKFERLYAFKFRNQLKEFRNLDHTKRMSINDADLFPVLDEATSETGFDAHYTYHPAWAARVVKKINPSKHIDISSILHFSTQLSAFIPTEFYDYRPAKIKLEGLVSKSGDLNHLPFADNSVESISCLHTIEHIGLGRYGDALDPLGDIKAVNELKRVVKSGGSLLLVTPVGKPRVQFNAQRVFSYEMIVEQFDDFEIMDFSLVTDKGDFISPAPPSIVCEQVYGCGCFWFKKY